MSTSTIHISITFDHEPIELNVLQDKLNWSNLVTLIDSMHPIETPVILYYKKDSTVETLENQEQLDELLIPNLKGLRFYGQKDLVNEPVYVFPGNALVRLTQFMDENKSVIASSHRLARWVGILASFISQDVTDASFDYEFQVLQNLVERKLNKSKRRERQHGETTDEQQEDCNEELSSRHRGRFGRENDPREKMFGHGSFGGRGHHGHGRKEDAETLFGHGPFGGRGRHFGGYGRHGRGDPREELFGYGSFGGHGLQGQDPRETLFGASPFGEHGFHFGGRGGRFGGGRGGRFGGGRGGRFGGGRGGHFGGRGGHFNGVFGDNGRSFQGPNSPFRGFGGPFGRHGGPFDGKHCHKAFFNADSSSEESGEESNKHNRDFTGFGKHGFGGKRFGKGMKGFYGRHGGFGRHASGFGPFGRGKKFGRCKKFGPEEDLFHGLHHGKGFKKHENHFHFA